MNSEQDLIEACKKNEPRAQRLLFDSYKRKIMGICLRYTSCREEADDVLQEAFIRIFDSLKKKDASEIRSLPSWVTGITINTAINMYYKNKKHINIPLELSTEANTAVDVGGILETLNAEDLLSLIQGMPEGYRIIFNLYIIEGFNHHEIAERLNITDSASRSQLTRAKEWLRSRLVAKEVLV